MGSCGDVDGGDTLLFLVKVLGFVVDEEVVGEDLVLFPETVLVELLDCCQPLVSHLVLDQYGLVESDRLSC